MEGLPEGRAPGHDRRSGDGGAGLLSSARKIVWLRHGRTAWNNAGRFQGQTDIPLDEHGVDQAHAAAAALADLAPHAIVVSDLQRARATAAPLAALTGLEAFVDVDLRETWAGEWEGLTHVEIRARYGDALDRWSTGADLRPGGGETRVEVAERVRRAVARALDPLPPDGTLVVVTHGGAARAGICSFLGLPPENWGALGVLANCSWSVLVESGTVAGATRWRLMEYNARSLPTAAMGDDR